MRRAGILQAVLVFMCAASGITLYDLLRDAHWMQPWWKSILTFLPEVGTLFAVFELRHSAEANELRKDRNRLAKENNTLIRANTELKATLDEERNEKLDEIAKGVQRPLTQLEKNAQKLMKYVGSPVVVKTQDGSTWSCRNRSIPDEAPCLLNRSCLRRPLYPPFK